MKNPNWTKAELRKCILLYETHRKVLSPTDKDVIELSKEINRTPNAICMKLGNFHARFNPGHGLPNGSKLEMEVYEKYLLERDKEAVKYTYQDYITHILGLLGVPSTAKEVFNKMVSEGELSKLNTETKTPEQSVQAYLQNGAKNGIYYRFKKDKLYHYGLIDWKESFEKEQRENEIEKEINNSSISETEKETIIKARRGQGRFRSNVIDIEKRSRLSPDVPVEWLTAGHFKPWSVSTNAERLDGNNGYLGTPNEDRALDKGYMSFNDDGSILFKEENRRDLELLHIDVNANVGTFNEKQREYLKYHRENVFKK